MTKEHNIEEVMDLVNLVEDITAQYMSVVAQGDNPFDEDRIIKGLKVSIESKLRELLTERYQEGYTDGFAEAQEYL